jgi:hypothetical protein
MSLRRPNRRIQAPIKGEYETRFILSAISMLLQPFCPQDEIPKTFPAIADSEVTRDLQKLADFKRKNERATQ